MKYRRSFVTNSSSSSYICDICGNTESGYDVSLSDAEMFQCENGHVICESHFDNSDILTKENLVLCLTDYIKEHEKSDNKWIKEAVEEYQEYINTIDDLDEDQVIEIFTEELEARYELPARLCPICNMSRVIQDDMFNYLLAKNNLSKKSVEDEIKKTFSSINELYAYNKRG